MPIRKDLFTEITELFTIETVPVYALTANRTFVKVVVSGVVEVASVGHLQVAGIPVGELAVVAFTLGERVSEKKRVQTVTEADDFESYR